VDNPAIATRLVCRERRLLLKEYQFQARPAHEQFKGRCESDDPATITTTSASRFIAARHARRTVVEMRGHADCRRVLPGRSGSGASGSWTTLASLASQSLNV